MNPNIWKKIVVPLLNMKFARLIAISTPGEEYNFYNEMVWKLLERHEEIALDVCVVAVDMICKACHHCGNYKCHHMKYLFPKWIRCERTSNLTDILLEGDVAVRARELYGKMEKDMSQSYEIRDIQWLKESEPYDMQIFLNSNIPVVIGIDPGGDNDKIAICSTVFYGESMIIIGLDETTYSEEIQVRRFLAAHIDHIRSMILFNESKIIITIEANGGRAKNLKWHILNAFPEDKNIFVIDEWWSKSNKRYQAGILSTNEITCGAHELSMTTLSEHRMRFASTLFSSNPLNQIDATRKREETKGEFIEQLQRVRKIYFGSRRTTRASRGYRYTGKCNSDGKRVDGQHDDMWSAMLMCITTYSYMLKNQFKNVPWQVMSDFNEYLWTAMRNLF